MTKQQCPQCNEWFADEDFDAHLQERHMNEAPVVEQCPHCGKRLETGESLESHLQEQHKELVVPGGLSDSQEARVRLIAREESGALKTILILTDLVVLFILLILWRAGLL